MVLSDDPVPAPEPVNPGTAGLVASYTLDGDVLDSSGNGNDGTLVGDPNFVEGQTGMALDLDGIDDLVELGKFDVVGQITLAAWIMPDDFEINDARIITKANEWSGDNHWWMVSTISETSLRFRLKTDEGPTTATLVSDPVLEAGVFAHVAATWDGSMMRIYKDGVEVASQEKGGTAVAVDPDISAAIGSQPSDAFASDPSHVVKFFDGLIDDVRIYDRALSETEIRYLAGERPTPVDPGTDGLMAYYALDGDPNDSSGNGNDGTIHNSETGGLGDGGSVWVDDPERGIVISFNGTADGAHVRAGEIPQMTLTNDFTWAFWAKQKAENTANNDIILGNRMDENAVDFVPRQFIKFTPTKFEWHMNGNGDDNLDYDDIPADVWLHHVVVKTADELTYYRNGVKASSGTFTQPLDSPQPLFFGGDNEGSAGENWNGLMSDVCIYDRALSASEVMYLAGYREFTFDGDELDDSWDHDNGSDQWDETGIGEGNPGGASLLSEDGVDFLRIQDTGDPRDYDMGDPGSNRKVYLTRLTDISLDGLRLEVGMRVATTPPLDDQHPDGGAGVAPWPAEGLGYHIRDGGKGMIGVSDGVGIISFSLAQAGEPMFEDVTTDVLIMNSLVGTDPTSDVDTGDAAAAVALNMMVVDDATQWNTFVIDIVAGGAGTHVVTISANGGAAESFDVTLGSDLEADDPFITIGSSGTGGITAFDVDYLKVGN
jgi:hypothetical protein